MYTVTQINYKNDYVWDFVNNYPVTIIRIAEHTYMTYIKIKLRRMRTYQVDLKILKQHVRVTIWEYKI